MATGLGGGVIRDVMIGAVPPAAVADWWYLAVPALGGLVTFWLHPAVGRLEREINVFDAFGLGLFCVAGALKAHVPFRLKAFQVRRGGQFHDATGAKTCQRIKSQLGSAVMCLVYDDEWAAQTQNIGQRSL